MQANKTVAFSKVVSDAVQLTINKNEVTFTLSEHRTRVNKLHFVATASCTGGYLVQAEFTTIENVDRVCFLEFANMKDVVQYITDCVNYYA